MVWPGEVFQPQEASPRQDFFKHTRKPFMGHDLPNFIEIGQMVWISVADIYTHNDFYILDGDLSLSK